VFEPKPGLGNARNAGVGIARGQLLAFTDDDCYPAPDFLSQIWSAFEHDPLLGYITGRILLHDPADHPMSINEFTTPRMFPGKSFIHAGDIQGANMAFRRTVLLDIGGFDPLFGAGSLFPSEDVDVAGRASAMGWTGQYLPEVIVRHHHRRKASDARSMRKSYAIGRGAYHMKCLLRGREFSWFMRSIYERPWPYETSRGTRRNPANQLAVFAFEVVWELAGGAKYAYVHLAQTLRTRLGKLLG
jgi:GT2 family glycosyltransferase